MQNCKKKNTTATKHFNLSLVELHKMQSNVRRNLYATYDALFNNKKMSANSFAFFLFAATMTRGLK